MGYNQNVSHMKLSRALSPVNRNMNRSLLDPIIKDIIKDKEVDNTLCLDLNMVILLN